MHQLRRRIFSGSAQKLYLGSGDRNCPDEAAVVGNAGDYCVTAVGHGGYVAELVDHRYVVIAAGPYQRLVVGIRGSELCIYLYAAVSFQSDLANGKLKALKAYGQHSDQYLILHVAVYAGSRYSDRILA